MSAGASALLALFLALSFAQARRVQDVSSQSQAAKTLSKVEPAQEAERSLLTQRKKTLNHDNIKWDALGLVNEKYTQQYKVDEDHGMFGKKYDFNLEQYEDENGKEVEKKIKRKLMKVKTIFFTAHGCVDIDIEQYEDNLAKKNLQLCKPNVVNMRYSWRVLDNDDKVLFTIQKRLWNDQKFILWGGRAVWKIYKGHKGDKSELIYYGTSKWGKDETKPKFKFWHNKKDYDEDKDWVAKIEHEEHEEDGEDEFKVKVKPNEDAALLLLSTYCVDYVADNKREETPEEEHEHDD